jgi:hypothetical protein
MPLSADSVAPFIPPNVLLDRGILTEPSAMGDEDEDVMANAINGEPFKNLTAPQEAWNLAAARRLKTREGPALKRRRTDPVEAYEHSNDLERAGSTGDWGNIPMREAESQMRPPADPVELGLITEREGKALLNA